VLHFLPDLIEVLFPLEVPVPGLTVLAFFFALVSRSFVSTLTVTLRFNLAVFLVIEVVVDLIPLHLHSPCDFLPLFHWRSLTLHLLGKVGGVVHIDAAHAIDIDATF